MCGSSVGVDALNAAAIGSTSTRCPAASRRNPLGEFIHALAMTTKTELRAPLTATGIPVSQWAMGVSRFQPYRYRPRKMASRKNAKPSAVNGRPKMAPENAMNRGHSRPSSNDSAVPDTAPTANRIPHPRDQRRASTSHASSRVRSHRPSATTSSRGRPTPRTANTMWNPSDVPIVARASVTLSKRPLSTIVGPVYTPNRDGDVAKHSARKAVRDRDRRQLEPDLHLRVDRMVAGDAVPPGGSPRSRQRHVLDHRNRGRAPFLRGPAGARALALARRHAVRGQGQGHHALAVWRRLAARGRTDHRSL